MLISRRSRPAAAPGPRTGLPTGKRGVIAIGPLTVQITDPFGLTTVTTAAAAATDLTVYPKLDTIRPLHQTHGRDPHAGAEHPNSIGQLGEDFYALRPYVVGDDLRRVHWASTARHDDLMVRQDELPWQGRASVLLDVRRAAHTPERPRARGLRGSEHRDGVLATTATSPDFSSPTAPTPASRRDTPHVEAIMEYLATVELSGTASMPRGDRSPGPQRVGRRARGRGGCGAFGGDGRAPAVAAPLLVRDGRRVR